MPAIRDRSAVRSSVIASAKYCCSRSSLRKDKRQDDDGQARGCAGRYDWWCRDRLRQTTTAGVRHDEGKAPRFMRHEAGTHRVHCPRHPSRLALFAMDAQKPDNGARLSRNPRKNFFPKCELPHTCLPIPERCCLGGRIGTLIWRMPVRKFSELPHSQPNRRTASSFRTEGFSAAPPSILQATPRGKNGRQNASARSR